MGPSAKRASAATPSGVKAAALGITNPLPNQILHNNYSTWSIRMQRNPETQKAQPPGGWAFQALVALVQQGLNL
ncbi:hypothetical protein StoSoilB22_30010 [Arthrobacter sp. StoSoilB22]|nr:hypothetical protein StoSoilB22_30010 [Arthrobacter sp. StoSoilB22]